MSQRSQWPLFRGKAELPVIQYEDPDEKDQDSQGGTNDREKKGPHFAGGEKMPGQRSHEPPGRCGSEDH